MTDAAPRRVIVGISGASGAAYGLCALRLLAPTDIEVHAVITPGAARTLELECDTSVAEAAALADVVHDDGDLAAAISSGGMVTAGMLVAPCSIKTLSAIASSYNDTLLVRAADVTLKQRRPLVLLVRETPLHLGHLRLMASVTEYGAIVMPPVPALYARPASVDELVAHTVSRALDSVGVHLPGTPRWSGPPE
jgi:4-hydroxy-3-polyprenylbenzoate decarboxylase